MDGKGRATDNTWIERFWKSLKHNYVYLNPADNGLELHQGILNYIEYYHHKKHQSLGMSPESAYSQQMSKTAA
jgi:putative transposase